VFINSSSKTVLNKKKPSLKIGSDASSGGQKQLQYFNYFPLHLAAATLSSCNVLFHAHTCYGICVPFLHAVYYPLISERNYPASIIIRYNFFTVSTCELFARVQLVILLIQIRHTAVNIYGQIRQTLGL